MVFLQIRSAWDLQFDIQKVIAMACWLNIWASLNMIFSLLNMKLADKDATGKLLWKERILFDEVLSFIDKRPILVVLIELISYVANHLYHPHCPSAGAPNDLDH